MRRGRGSKGVRLRASCAGLALGALGVLCHASASQAQQGAPAAEPVAAEAPPKVLVQITGDAPPERKRSLSGALEAQLAALELALEVDVDAPTPESAAARFERGRTLAAASHARAVFWIELDGEVQWFVYVMDPSDERILVRQLDASSPAAAVEAAAVIVKAATQALLAGNLDGLDAQELPAPTAPVAKEPPPAPPPPTPAPPASEPAPAPAPEPTRGGLRLAVGYAGCTFASEHTWQSGVSLSAAWITDSGLYFGLGYAWMQPSEPDDPVAIRVQRHPVAATFGKRLWKGRLAVDLEAGVVVDTLTRETTKTPVAVESSSDSTRVAVALVPRLRTELELFAPLALFLDLGLGYVLNNFEYIAEDPTRVVLAPHRLRAELGAGLALRL